MSEPNDAQLLGAQLEHFEAENRRLEAEVRSRVGRIADLQRELDLLRVERDIWREAHTTALEVLRGS